MKKVLAFILICALLCTLAACGNKKAPEAKASANNSSSSTASNTENQVEASDANAAAVEEGTEAQGVSVSSGITVDGENGDTDTSDDGEDAAPSQYKTCQSLDELNAYTGANFARPVSFEVTEETYEAVLSGETVVGQYVFLISEFPSGIRFSPDTTVDISEVYRADGTSAFEGVEGESVCNVDGTMVGRWFTSAGQYVLVFTNDDEDFFDSLFEEMKELTAVSES